MHARRQEKTRCVDRDAAPGMEITNWPECIDLRHQLCHRNLDRDMPHTEVRIAVVSRIGFEQGLEGNLADSDPSSGITRMRIPGVSRLRALDDRKRITPPHDDPGMTEFISLEEQWGNKVQLERIEQACARRLVKKNYVAGSQTLAHPGE